ncbi:MAG: alpha-L-glutamate ligase, partial [Sphingomonas sp.]
MTDLAILYEHPAWFAPLFAALERRGVDFATMSPDGDWNPAAMRAPAPVLFNRIAMSSFLRADEHPIFHTIALLDHWRRLGARVVNGAEAMAIDASKARQLALIASLGLAIPETRVVHRAADVVAAAGALRFPIVVKANIGGSGAGIVRFDTTEELRAGIADGALPTSIDGVLLVQEYVPVRGGAITRIET